jgi:sugar phosphate isomerase/epimerase
MQLGLMNNPGRDPMLEISRIAKLGFDFVDLTLEPPQARVDTLNLGRIRAALTDRNLSVIGHTAYYLPFASAYDSIHQAAIEEAVQCLNFFAELGVSAMNVHVDSRAPGHSPDWIRQRNIAAYTAILVKAQELGLTLMVENGEGDDADYFAPIFEAIPDLGLHLDIGHANINTRKSHAPAFLSRFGDRLKHVHLSDNKGRSDDHLAIGAGSIDWKKELKALKATGYDGTITLEVFYGDSELITYSRDKVRTIWESF